MASLAPVDLEHVSDVLRLPHERVRTVVELLDSGNTVPFITRYRKDQTGGLDEEQIRNIQTRVVKLRMLAERKQTILRSIDAQGKLTPELAAAIEAADTTKRLEDLYLPFKPKKQTLATTARSRGLEPLALEILNADPLAQDLDLRAADFVNPDKKVKSPADALLGAGHVLAEMFSERADFRGKIRAILERTGVLTSTRVETESAEPPSNGAKNAEAKSAGRQQLLPFGEERQASPAKEPEKTPDETPPAEAAAEGVATALDAVGPAPNQAELFAIDSETESAEAPAVDNTEETAATPAADVASQAEPAEPTAEASAAAASEEAAGETPTATTDAAISDAAAATGTSAAAEAPTADGATAQAEAAPRLAAAAKRKLRKEKQKKKQEAQREAKEQQAYRDYFKYSEPLSKVPPHRVLAINRGERARVLRVKVEVDLEPMHKVIDEVLAPEDHPHRDFLRGCGRDALMRLVLPSLEREVRRELTDRAEAHAVGVFARNLRNLLLQPPIRDRRILAIDPGFRSGCKLAALDEFGNLLDHGVIHLVGKEERRAAAKETLIDLVRKHNLNVIAIGNGTGCRETEQWISELISTDLADTGIAYTIVNEAGASVYSTSRIGREEFPQYDATLRGAISIGRRLQDPLSELVKIDPANIGVGMYQHDVKAKHLKDSLDAVVESCVNFVGVDLNTASPALLRYVSGLNQLTAQRVYDHRRANGPFKNREELKTVPGFGEATFVQAAGFLKIVGGDNPLDATWIHPESYPLAETLLAKLDSSPAALADKSQASPLAERAAKLNPAELAAELQVGELTLSDILAQLARPGRDPREALPQPIFKRGILKIDDLTPGMDLTGTVLNVVDFGAFVDIGLKDSGLVHVSQLANKFVQTPHEVVSVGDIVKVWVLDVDKQRRRVSLTMIDPASRRPAQESRQKPERPAQQRGGQSRPPRDRQARTKHSRPPAKSSPPMRKAKPKPLVPLTKSMREGKEPLRTFGDLKQFFDLKREEETKSSDQSS